MREVCIIGSNIHHVPASQANNNQFRTEVHVAYFFTVYNHAIESIRVDNNLCVDVWIITRENSPRERIHSICRGCEHSRIFVVGGSNVCFDNVKQNDVMQTGTVFRGGHVRTECHVSGGTWEIIMALIIIYSIVSTTNERFLQEYFTQKVQHQKGFKFQVYVLLRSMGRIRSLLCHTWLYTGSRFT